MLSGDNVLVLKVGDQQMIARMFAADCEKHRKVRVSRRWEASYKNGRMYECREDRCKTRSKGKVPLGDEVLQGVLFCRV